MEFRTKFINIIMFLIVIVIILQWIVFHFIGSMVDIEGEPVYPHRKTNITKITHAFHRDCNSSFMPTQLLHENGQFIFICNITYHKSTSYLPNKKLLTPYFDPLIEQNIQDMFHRVQFNDDSPSHLIKLPKWGTASTLKHVSKMIGKHYANGVSVIYGNLTWKFTDYACGTSWSCFFSPLDNGDLRKGNFQIWSDWENRLLHPDEEVMCGLHGKYNVTNGRCECEMDHILVNNICRLYPADFIANNIDLNRKTNPYDEPGEHTLDAHNCAVRGKAATDYETYYGPLYYSSQILWFLFKSAPKKYILDNYASGIHDDKHKSIAVHIRRGDACDVVEKDVLRQCYQLIDYLKIARKMYQIYRSYEGEIFTIYIATDDESVIKEVQSARVMHDYPYFNFKYHQELNRTIFDAKFGYWENNAQLRNSLMVQELLMDIWAMKECHFFIGDFTSTIARLAYELMLHKKGYYPPYHSMHMQWCETATLFEFKNKTIWC